VRAGAARMASRTFTSTPPPVQSFDGRYFPEQDETHYEGLDTPTNQEVTHQPQPRRAGRILDFSSSTSSVAAFTPTRHLGSPVFDPDEQASNELTGILARLHKEVPLSCNGEGAEEFRTLSAVSTTAGPTPGPESRSQSSASFLQLSPSPWQHAADDALCQDQEWLSWPPPQIVQPTPLQDQEWPSWPPQQSAQLTPLEDQESPSPTTQSSAQPTPAQTPKKKKQAAAGGSASQAQALAVQAQAQAAAAQAAAAQAPAASVALPAQAPAVPGQAAAVPAQAAAVPAQAAAVPAQASPAQTPKKKKQATKMFVGGVPQNMNQDDYWKFLEGVVGDNGSISNCWIQKPRQGDGMPTSQNHRGFGFVVFKEASTVRKLLDGQESRFILTPDGRRMEFKAAESTKKQQRDGTSGPTAQNEAPPAQAEAQRDRALSGQRPPQQANDGNFASNYGSPGGRNLQSVRTSPQPMQMQQQQQPPNGPTYGPSCGHHMSMVMVAPQHRFEGGGAMAPHGHGGCGMPMFPCSSGVGRWSGTSHAELQPVQPVQPMQMPPVPWVATQAHARGVVNYSAQPQATRNPWHASVTELKEAEPEFYED